MTDMPSETQQVVVALLREISATNQQTRDSVQHLAETMTEWRIDQVRLQGDVEALKQFRDDTEHAARKAADERRAALTARVSGAITAAISGVVGYLLSFLKGSTPPPPHH